MEEMELRLRSLVVQDPKLVATLEKVGRKEAEPYSSAMEFLGASSFPTGWPASSADNSG